MGCNLAIYDYEPDYANHLMDYIKRKQKRITQVRVFTNQSSLREYLEHDKINILLLADRIPVEEVQHDNIKHICLLSEGNFVRESSGYPVIYKFQSAELIIQELFSYFPLILEEGRRIGSSGQGVKVVSIFSINRETEQTLLSLSLARQYAGRKKTLYINLAIFQTFPELKNRDTEKSLSEFIYYLKQNHPSLITKMQGIITRMDQLDYIQGVTFGPDLYELTTDDMVKWIKELRECNEYEIIIFDVGSFFQATLELFRESDQVLLVLGENEWEQSKFHSFKGQLLWAGFEDVIQKLKVVPLTRVEQESYQSFLDNGWYSEEYCELAASFVEE